MACSGAGSSPSRGARIGAWRDSSRRTSRSTVLTCHSICIPRLATTQCSRGSLASRCAASSAKNTACGSAGGERSTSLGTRSSANWRPSRAPHRGCCRSAITGTAPRLLPFGPERVRRVGVVTGAAGSMIAQAAAAGLDTFVTGEGPHHTFFDAEELKLNVFYAGHYATETVGVQALAGHLRDRFQLPWTFLDHPTGL